MITTEYDKKGNVTGDIFDVIHYAGTIGYKYINTIVYPNAESQHVVFDDNVKYVVWFCKDVQKMRFNKDPIRTRKLLLHKREINKLIGIIQQKGLSLVPIKLYFQNNLVKLEFGIGKGKKLYDKREAIAKKDAQRKISRATKNSFDY